MRKTSLPRPQRSVSFWSHVSGAALAAGALLLAPGLALAQACENPTGAPA